MTIEAAELSDDEIVVITKVKSFKLRSMRALVNHPFESFFPIFCKIRIEYVI